MKGVSRRLFAVHSGCLAVYSPDERGVSSPIRRRGKVAQVEFVKGTCVLFT